ncbi:D-lactate dehydrogenase [Hyphomonas sp. CACIAM 19H1]|uniref:D-lactate dehydrogenase n=1 Tax=Hyphomonas sp. CACIAM 19H1 TaxID=1873716 RepID=UPI000DED5C1F|nr:D-lactate dehydrogenase [Hyphomonas sp. CACIAM 19H1]AXE64071.1 D-lactate dehydrogenase [Hyphomonas sp. CACIAM 19H1]
MISDAALIRDLKTIAGAGHVHTGAQGIRRFVTGYRHGEGRAVAVVLPGSLVDLWRIARACVRAGRIIIMQAANTGLTGGSTPDGVYDRGVVVINTMRLKGIHMLNAGAQVVCLPGATLFELERELRPLNREPHSEIGSSCLGASVQGGVCNSSGGALVRRGPAYTEAAIYARVDETGDLRLVNELGIELGRDPEKQLENLERGNFARVLSDMHERACSAKAYVDHVREVDAASPARYNADPRFLKGVSGSAGRVVVFAVRLDTFPKPVDCRAFHLATDDPTVLSDIRRRMLKDAALVPIAAEYMHRDVFRMAERYGKDTFLAVRMLGVDRLPMLFRLKAAVDGLAVRMGFGGLHVSDRTLQWLSRLAPQHLPDRFRQMGARYEHHLLIRVDGEQVDAVRELLAARLPAERGEVNECSPREGRKVFLHRFVAAGAAIRYALLRGSSAGGLVALDVALRRNDKVWWYVLPDHLREMVDRTLVYGHYFCHVFHQDFILKKDADAEVFKRGMLRHYTSRGAECPAEHNVGHLYEAKPALAEFYRDLDPTNSLNPGIGKTSRLKNWR